MVKIVVHSDSLPLLRWIYTYEFFTFNADLHHSWDVFEFHVWDFQSWQPWKKVSYSHGGLLRNNHQSMIVCPFFPLPCLTTGSYSNFVSFFWDVFFRWIWIYCCIHVLHLGILNTIPIFPINPNVHDVNQVKCESLSYLLEASSCMCVFVVSGSIMFYCLFFFQVALSRSKRLYPRTKNNRLNSYVEADVLACPVVKAV